MVKKTNKKPTKNGIKQKQKQTVIVNINNGKTRVKRQPVKPSVKNQPQYINTYPVFVPNEPSPPVIYQSPPVLNQSPVIPVKITNEIATQSMNNTREIGSQAFIPQTVYITKKKTRKLDFVTPKNDDTSDSGNVDFIPPRTPPINLEMFYGSKDTPFVYENDSRRELLREPPREPPRRRTIEEIREDRRLVKNQKERERKQRIRDEKNKK